MPYIRVETSIKGSVEVTQCYAPRFGKPGVPRGKNARRTCIAAASVNENRADRIMRQKAALNFGRGDLYITLKYRKELRPLSASEAGSQLQAFIRKIRPELAKVGCPGKWMAFMEIGERGALHIHVLLPEIPLSKVKNAWQYGPVHAESVYTETAEKIALYHVEENKKTLYRTGEASRRYWCGRGLLDPRAPEFTKVTICKASNWRAVAQIPKNALLVGDVFDGVDMFGHMYRRFRYILPKNEIKRRSRK